jgi:hypothetical protein
MVMEAQTNGTTDDSQAINMKRKGRSETNTDRKKGDSRRKDRVYNLV